MVTPSDSMKEPMPGVGVKVNGGAEVCVAGGRVADGGGDLVFVGVEIADVDSGVRSIRFGCVSFELKGSNRQGQS